MLKIGGTLTAKDLVELASDTHVYVSGTIQSSGGGNVDKVKITARGTGLTGVSIRDEVTGLQAYVNTSYLGVDTVEHDPVTGRYEVIRPGSQANEVLYDGNTVLYDRDNSHYYQRISGGKYVYQGNEITASGSTVKTYFTNNADGTGSVFKLMLTEKGSYQIEFTQLAVNHI